MYDISDQAGGLAQTTTAFKKKICLSGKLVSVAGELWIRFAASRHTQSLFPALLSWPGSGCQVGCFGAAKQPQMTLVMAAVQLGYSTDREALSDTTMGAACHNTDALTGGTAGMLLPCLQATGMEGWMNGRTD